MVGIGFIDNQKRAAAPQSKLGAGDDATGNRDNAANRCKTDIANGVNGQLGGAHDRKPSMDQPIDAELVARARQLLRKQCEAADDWRQVYCQEHYDELMNDEPGTSCWRYIVYNDHDLDKAVDLMKRALAWRRENGIAELRDSAFIKEYWHWSPIGMSGVSRDGHDVVFVCGRLYRKPEPIFRDPIRKFILHQIFTWDKAHRHDLGQYVVVFETSQTGYSNIDVDLMSWVVSIIDYTPARIAAVYVTGVPLLIRPVVRLIISWLPERFKRIVYCGTFDELVKANMDDSAIPVECGGTNDSRYRIAPAESPWLRDTELAADEAWLRAMKGCICFGLGQDRLEFLERQQVEFERSADKKQ